jgi:hypothetical protein
MVSEVLEPTAVNPFPRDRFWRYAEPVVKLVTVRETVTFVTGAVEVTVNPREVV